MATLVFDHPIHLHCINSKTVYSAYNRTLYPMHLEMLREPWHFVWLPSTPAKGSPISHVLPARPSKLSPWQTSVSLCGATSVGRCMHAINVGSPTVNWVECSDCEQWFHCDCVGVELQDVQRQNWLCGCNIFKDSCQFFK